MLPSIMTSRNGQEASLDSQESQEELTAVNIHSYELLGCLALATVVVSHAKC